MPSRPGPQPYECIRRPWHSDSHSSLRGSVIQEIFRLVHEIHSISTRRKKEWQEKLPTVVLQTEEILYYKANSEGEYADVATLKSRLDDALNMMIQKKDGQEEAVYLLPCMEAALSLRCAPKRGTRGQQQGSSRYHLNAAKQALSMPEQEICLLAHRSNSAAAFWNPTCPNVMLIPSQNPASHSFPEVFYPAGNFSFLKPVALLQVPMATDACTSSCIPLPDFFPSLPQLAFDLTRHSRPLQFLDSAHCLEALEGSILPCTTPIKSSHCTFKSLLQDAVTSESCDAVNHHQSNLTFGAVFASACDSARSTVQSSCPSVAQDKELNFKLKDLLSLPSDGCHGSRMPDLRDLCDGRKKAISPWSCAGTLCEVDDESDSSLGVTDLQLRLGPPVNKPIVLPDELSFSPSTCHQIIE